jgi:hypothetical protein
MSLDRFAASDLEWRKAKRSVNDGACVEVAPADGQIFVRDTQDRKGPVVRYPGFSWRAFVAEVKTSKADLDSL